MLPKPVSRSSNRQRFHRELGGPSGSNLIPPQIVGVRPGNVAGVRPGNAAACAESPKIQGQRPVFARATASSVINFEH
jgi:hypothetical protein